MTKQELENIIDRLQCENAQLGEQLKNASQAENAALRSELEENNSQLRSLRETLDHYQKHREVDLEEFQSERENWERDRDSELKKLGRAAEDLAD
jgi:hypothetical protein